MRYFTPEALRTEIVAFDRGGTFQPGEYELKAPTEAQTEEGRKRYNKGSGSDTSRNVTTAKRTKRSQRIKVAAIKRHNVAGVRPKGAVR